MLSKDMASEHITQKDEVMMQEHVERILYRFGGMPAKKKLAKVVNEEVLIPIADPEDSKAEVEASLNVPNFWEKLAKQIDTYKRQPPPPESSLDIVKYLSQHKFKSRSRHMPAKSASSKCLEEVVGSIKTQLSKILVMPESISSAHRRGKSSFYICSLDQTKTKLKEDFTHTKFRSTVFQPSLISKFSPTPRSRELRSVNRNRLSRCSSKSLKSSSKLAD